MIDLPLRGRVRLVDAGGDPHRLDGSGGTVTLVAFWARYCPHSVVQLAGLQAVSDRLRAGGVRVLAVTAEEPSGEARSYLAQRGLTFPVYHDVERDAQRAFENMATPRYFVVDASGRIRFDGYTPEAAERAAVVLRELRRAGGAGK